MQARTIKEVEDAILDQYLTVGKALTVKEIREECGKSETIIRRVVYESRRIAITHKEVRIMSRQYPTMVHQHRSVDAFQPTRDWLIEIIKTTRREYDYFRTERKWR